MDENNEMNNETNEANSDINAEAGEGAAAEVGKKKKSMGRELLEWVEAIGIAIVVALLVRQFVMTVVMVDGDSMNNTLHDQERLLVWELGYKPSNGDIVIFEPPVTPTGEVVGKTYYVKRVIATEGQTVKIDFDLNTVTVDGEVLDEYYIKSDETDVMEQKAWNSIEEYTVPEGEVFVMGDNRNNSFDSRSMGCVKSKKILGKVLVRFWPLNKLGTVR